jgi:hypothetical protein
VQLNPADDRFVKEKAEAAQENARNQQNEKENG